MWEDMGRDLIPAFRKEFASAFYALFERQVDTKGTVIKIETEGRQLFGEGNGRMKSSFQFHYASSQEKHLNF
jgi:hypothetical protein